MISTNEAETIGYPYVKIQNIQTHTQTYAHTNNFNPYLTQHTQKLTKNRLYA